MFGIWLVAGLFLAAGLWENRQGPFRVTVCTKGQPSTLPSLLILLERPPEPSLSNFCSCTGASPALYPSSAPQQHWESSFTLSSTGFSCGR